MVKVVEGQLNASGKRFGIVASRFNDFVTSRLIDGAVDTLTRHGCDDGALTLVRVPGAFEIPVAVRRVATAGEVDAVIALGCVIRGQTPHFEYICAEVTKGLGHVAMYHGFPVSYGVITADTLEQAIERSGVKAGNKGAEAAAAAIEMVSLFDQLPGGSGS
jgi:6,7-dimethyl-8-ribityllumazine synthase